MIMKNIKFIFIGLSYILLLSIFGLIKPIIEYLFIIFSFTAVPAMALFIAWFILAWFWYTFELDKKFDIDSLLYIGSIILLILIIIIAHNTWSIFPSNL